MGLSPFWQEDVFLTVQGFYNQAQILSAEPNFVIGCGEKLVIHLIPFDNNFTPQGLVLLQDTYQDQNLFLIHLWEDIWFVKRKQVLSRIKSFLGFNKTYHGRKTKILNLNLAEASTFLNENHLQGHVKSKYYYGLLLDNQLIAVASFSDTRPMKTKGENYKSAELIRFASLSGFTIVGGLSKLIKHFLKQVKVDDLMSYADRDWSIGKGYDKLGFKMSEITDPSYLYFNKSTIERYFPHRLPKTIITNFESQNILSFDEFLVSKSFVKIFNTGNLKYHLYL